VFSARCNQRHVRQDISARTSTNYEFMQCNVQKPCQGEELDADDKKRDVNPSHSPWDKEPGTDMHLTRHTRCGPTRSWVNRLSTEVNQAMPGQKLATNSINCKPYALLALHDATPLHVWCQRTNTRPAFNGTCYKTVSQWCYNGVTMVVQWCHNGVTKVLRWCYNGVIVVLL
jgi:hypothetical protein